MIDFEEINPEFARRYRLIDDSYEFSEFMSKPLRPSIRVNTLKGSLEDIVSLLSEKYKIEPVPWCREGFFIDIDEDSSIGTSIEHQLGLIFSQEASSMIPPVVLDVKPGMLVLDMAAAPGAKTTQIAQYMQNEGCIIANDVKVGRLNILISNLQRCGVLIARVTMMDGRSFRKYENTFDAVLLDAPCSNAGMIRKNYKYLKIWRLKDVESLSRLQKQLIMAAYAALKPGGVLVYSTCTLDPAENEDVVDHLLANTDARLEEIDLPVKRHKPFTSFDGKEFSSEVKKCLRIHPQDNDTEGFFVAKIVKEA
ncbi:NOL1/NOP2/sun family putative RNA methylase [Archaeoglobus veneficus]|uniref:RNA methylase, NOL1/NOP2/sun family n=1 Tax=Archaeoglobus veneficus (strain DSM 11195 / SNP6) TaxID=693661 RepID=F2KS61_ARCVS|nr:NOL1/NOP2/sun family putative RNA methylase [Archaeoglobus veneficus]AEA48000.1 RNA methylase, NOL1/NOP2/sun family [Archaeoglobus veneficus SNP6]